MYPNPQEALRLPQRREPQDFAELAAALVTAHHGGGAEAIAGWALELVRASDAPPAGATRSVGETDAKLLAERIARHARERLTSADDPLGTARHVVARVFGFESWTALGQHAAALQRADSAVAAFERAADAIVGGDVAALDRELAARSGLGLARSDRTHRATLLHYTSANGVEGFRQHTPLNVIDCARRLLAAGAEVDAEADVYGGGMTTLALVVTSTPPRRAGVQNRLTDLLLDHGARIPRGIVRDCLANGCPEAARHLAERGAALSLEEAAGLGRLPEVGALLADTRTRPQPKPCLR